MRGSFETLENRLVLSVPVVGADGSETFAAATPVGKLNGPVLVQNALAGGESTDFYSFSLRSQGNVNLTLGGLSANANMRLFDADGRQLAISNRTKTRSDWLSLSLGRGTYTVSVDRGKRAENTSYALTMQADLNFETVRIDGANYDIGLTRADGSSAAIVPDRETWVVIHGWQSTPKATHRVATAIQAASRRIQVLELDWRQAAADANVAAVALRVADVGAFVAQKLAAWEIPGGSINLVGHSLGGYMTDEIARRVSGGVNRVVALDPATPSVAGVDVSDTNYAAHSQYSIAMVGSNFAQLTAARTADETVTLDVGKWSGFSAHSNVREIFATMVEQNNARGGGDAVSAMFSLKAIGSADARGFRRDGMGTGYEAHLVGEAIEGVWYPSTLTYKNSRGRTTTVSA